MHRTYNLPHLPPLHALHPSALPSRPYTPSLPSIRQLNASGAIPSTSPASSHRAHNHTHALSPLHSTSPTDALRAPHSHPHSTCHNRGSTAPSSSTPHKSRGSKRSTSSSVPSSSVPPPPPRVRHSLSLPHRSSARTPSRANAHSFGQIAEPPTGTSSSTEQRSGGTTSSSPTNTYSGKKRKQPEPQASRPAALRDETSSPPSSERGTRQFCFRCRFCPAQFQTRTQRKEHLKEKHPKPFGCTECPRRFRRKFDCHKHFLTVHQRMRPFKCAQCPSEFGQKHHLLRHNNSVHLKAKEFRCDHCAAKFARKERLQNHLKSLHGYFDFVCRLCGSGFNDRSVGLLHMTNVHKVSAAKPGTLLASPTDSS